MRNQTLNIKFPGHLVKKVDEAANRKYITRSAFIREAVAEKLDREEVKTEEPQIDWQKLLDDET